MLAAWVNVAPDQLPSDKEWIEHSNDHNAQAWKRVGLAAQAFIEPQLAALKADNARLTQLNNELLASLRIAQAVIEKDGRFGETVKVLNEVLDEFEARQAS
jgi:hypothetical protein